MAVAVSPAVAGATVARRNRREAAAAEQRSRAERLASERRDAVLAERERIAHELHDLAAHSVAVISVLAETAPFAAWQLPPESKKQFAEIVTSARDALGELRDLLSVLRRQEHSSRVLGTRPAPDLERAAAPAGGGAPVRRLSFSPAGTRDMCRRPCSSQPTG